MKKSLKLKLITISIFIAVYSVLIFIIAQNKNEKIDIELNRQIENLKTQYDITSAYSKITANAIFYSTSNMKKVINIFAEAREASKEKRDALREEMHKILKEKYKIIKSKGVLQYMFVFPDNTTFLRMHKPSKYGDDLTDIRYSHKYVNETKKPVSGFEHGRTSHAFRYVYPMFDSQNNHLGILEVGFASETMQKNLNKSSNIHSHFIVDKHIFDVKAWKREDAVLKYIPSIEHEDYLFTSEGKIDHKELAKIKEEIIEPLKEDIIYNISLKKPFALYIPVKNSVKIIAFLPIKNIKEKKVVAYIVSYTDNKHIYYAIYDYRIASIVMFFVLAFLFFFIYKNLSHKQLLEAEVKEKTKRLSDKKNQLEKVNKSLEVKIQEAVNENREKDRVLAQQSKMAAMGEMLENIAHQWRQPLSVISTLSTGVKMQKEFGALTDEDLVESMEKINDTVQHLSKTINDFRDFFKSHKEKTFFSVKEVYYKTLKLLNSKSKNREIEVIENIEDVSLVGLDGELVQVIMNLLNNARDVLETKRDQRRLIFVDIYKKRSDAVLKIRDNAGGVPENIIDKVFEPYFTTKHKTQGIGIGLYMSEEIISKHMGGTIDVRNVHFEYGGKNYAGAEFTITLPIEEGEK